MSQYSPTLRSGKIHNPADTAPVAHLSKDDLVVCTFGPQYYLGTFVGSSVTLVLVLALMRRTYKRGMVNVQKAMQMQTSDKVQNKIDILEKYAPSGKSANATREKMENFQKEQVSKAKTMYNVDIYAWCLVRVCMLTATLKVIKMYFSWSRYTDFLFEEYYASEIAGKIIEDALQREKEEVEKLKVVSFLNETNNNNNNLQQQPETKQTEKKPPQDGKNNSNSSTTGGSITREEAIAKHRNYEKAKRELQLLEDAIRVKALEDFRQVAEMEKKITDFQKYREDLSKTPEQRERERPLVMEELNDIDVRTGGFGRARKPTSMMNNNNNLGNSINSANDMDDEPRPNTMPNFMPTFWDGVAVGVWGSIVDADVPRKNVKAYLGMKAGKSMW